MAKPKRSSRAGFTLIELSIVLVIIGLIVGGVLVGQDLIRAAEIRATITQVEKFNTARNSFYGKYGALPGDMNNGVALTFGFLSRQGVRGQGDGNGLIDGEGSSQGWLAQCGYETGMYWSDLTYANGMNLNLIEGSFGGPGSPIGAQSTVSPSSTQLAGCFPAAKLGRSNYFYVYNSTGYNYFGLVGMTGTSVVLGVLTGVPAMSVLQAYTIDNKTDDGFPMTGVVAANYANGVDAISLPMPWADGLHFYDMHGFSVQCLRDKLHRKRQRHGRAVCAQLPDAVT